MLSIISLALVATMAAAKPIVLPTYNASDLPHLQGFKQGAFGPQPPHLQGLQQGAYSRGLQARQGASGWGSNGAGGCSTARGVATNPNDATPGDGDPHQNYWHVQLSEPISCGAGGCSVGETETQSISVGFTIGFSPGDVDLWFTPSFSVTESWSTGNTYTCSGDPNGRVAIWQNVAHTAYSVWNTPSGNCGYDNSDYATYVNIYKAPNDNNQGGGFYCVRDDGDGAVRNQGDGYWEDGCAGGPQGYCGNGNVLS